MRLRLDHYRLTAPTTLITGPVLERLNVDSRHQYLRSRIFHRTRGSSETTWPFHSESSRRLEKILENTRWSFYTTLKYLKWSAKQLWMATDVSLNVLDLRWYEWLWMHTVCRSSSLYSRFSTTWPGPLRTPKRQNERPSQNISWRRQG